MSSFAVSKLYTVKTPLGEEIILGGPEDYVDKSFNGDFFVVLSVIDKWGNETKIMSQDAEWGEPTSLQETIREGEYNQWHAGHIINVSEWQNGLTLYNEQIENNMQLVELYDPEFFCVGTKYKASEVQNFLNVISDNSLENIISDEYLSEDSTLFEIKQIVEHINLLDKNPANLQSFESEYRAWMEETHPVSFMKFFANEFPQLNIPLGSYGMVFTKNGKYLGFYPELVNEMNQAFMGTKTVNIDHVDVTQGDFAPGFYSYLGMDSQVELHGGQVHVQDFEIGDIVLMGEISKVDHKYMIIVGKEIKPDGSVAVAGIEADRYGQRRITMIGITEENLNDVLGIEEGEVTYFLRNADE
jgi:hypothetical protein